MYKVIYYSKMEYYNFILTQYALLCIIFNIRLCAEGFYYAKRNFRSSFHHSLYLL
jgi:hypothetical protein